jgi:DNA repair exonuclease SbcCD ATPase subunit
MKIKAYEEMLENMKAFEAAKEANNGQLAAAAAEVDQARQRLNDLLNKALEKPEELAAEVGKAQGMVTIAETKLQRLQAKLDVENSTPGKQFPSGITVAFQNVQAEIRRNIANGSLIEEEFQPILDELNEHRKAYMTMLEAVFIKMHEVNKSLAHIQHSTASAVRRYTDKDVSYGMLGPEALSESDFKEWAWVEKFTYDNDLYAIRKSADPALKLPAPEMRNSITPTSRTFQEGNMLS